MTRPFEICKKKCLCLLTLFFIIGIYAQTLSISPKEVYVGDEAEIRFSFEWNGELFSNHEEQLVHVIHSSSIEESLDNSYTIKSLQLFPSHNGYELSIIVVPWKAGTLNLEPFDLATLFDINTTSILIDIPEIEIQSILAQVHEKEIRAPLGPVIIPGTTYILVVIVIILFVLCLLIVIILIRFPLIKAWVKSFVGKIWASDNLKKASKDLILLSKHSSSLEAKIFAARLSIIIRTYLEGRFYHPFTAEATSSFFTIFDELFAGTTSSKAESFLQDLYEICVRCDFLHYAGNETEKAPLTQAEIESLIERTRQAIIYFEKDADSDEEGGA